jgi:hypothetical protein
MFFVLWNTYYCYEVEYCMMSHHLQTINKPCIHHRRWYLYTQNVSEIGGHVTRVWMFLILHPQNGVHMLLQVNLISQLDSVIHGDYAELFCITTVCTIMFLCLLTFLKGQSRLLGSLCCVYVSPVKLWSQLTFFMKLHIQGVPGGMCQTSGGCSLC